MICAAGGHGGGQHLAGTVDASSSFVTLLRDCCGGEAGVGSCG